MKLVTFTPEILRIGAVQGVAYDVAADLFLNNVKDYGKADDQYDYNDGKFNYAPLVDHLAELQDSYPEYLEFVDRNLDLINNHSITSAALELLVKE